MKQADTLTRLRIQREAMVRGAHVSSRSAARAFLDGFSSSIVGGLLYCVVLANWNPVELNSAWQQVLALSLAFGGFETWRATRKRP